VSSLLVFPGQGAQQPGMLQRLPRETLTEASDVLGEDVALLDSADALRSTRAVQLCLLIAGVTASRQLLQDELEADYVAGLSIGAYPAAVVAGALSFSDALNLVSLRGELMQQAYPQGFGMTAIIGLQLSTVETLLAQVHSAESPVYLANINADNQVVIAGSDDGGGTGAQSWRPSGQTPGGERAVTLSVAGRAGANPRRSLRQRWTEHPENRLPEWQPRASADQA
jgi:malonate decarboxylase epsilon subunit